MTPGSFPGRVSYYRFTGEIQDMKIKDALKTINKMTGAEQLDESPYAEVK